MGVPSINLQFIERAISAIERSSRGVVLLGLKDKKAAAGSYKIVTVEDIPEGLSDANKAQIKAALKGYTKAPNKVLVYVWDEETEAEAAYKGLFKFGRQTKFDYLAIPTVETDDKKDDVASWIKSVRTTGHKRLTRKAVLPNCAADNEGVINVTTGADAGDTHYTPEQMCARVAGILAGTPANISATYAPLMEMTGCESSKEDDDDAAVDRGELILVWDGEKAKICRAVNSLVTTTQDKGDSFKKVKLIENMDMMYDDIVQTAEDSYIGKYVNDYDGKCLLITAINGYFQQLINEKILSVGVASINIPAQRAFLKSGGKKVALDDGSEKDVDDCTDDEIKRANTGSKVFLRATVRINDAIEDIDFQVYI